MPWYDIIWNFEPGGNVEHIAEHGLTPEDVEAVIRDPLDKTFSRSTGRPVRDGLHAGRTTHSRCLRRGG